MNVLHFPWLELAIAITLIGPPCLSRLRHPDHVYRWSVVLIGATFGCTVLAWLAFYVDVPAMSLIRLSVQPALFGRQLFVLDELNAPLLPTVALLHFLTALSTVTDLHAAVLVFMVDGRRDDWPDEVQLQGTVDLDRPLAISTVPPYVELLNRRRPTRVYSLHMTLFVGLLVAGLGGRDARRGASAQFHGGPSFRSWSQSSSGAALCPRIAG